MILRVVLGIAILLCGWGFLFAQKPWKEYPAIEYSTSPFLPTRMFRMNGPARASNTPIFSAARTSAPPPTGPWTIRARTAICFPASPGCRASTRARWSRSSSWTAPTISTTGLSSMPWRWATGSSPRSRPNSFAIIIDRGGFLMVDDFHGDTEWSVFMDSLRKVFPDRDVEDLSDSSEIFHTLYDLQHRIQVAGAGAVQAGVTYEQPNDGGRVLTGAPSITIRTRWWSPFVTTWIWATPGSTPTIPGIRPR